MHIVTTFSLYKEGCVAGSGRWEVGPNKYKKKQCDNTPEYDYALRRTRKKNNVGLHTCSFTIVFATDTWGSKTPPMVLRGLETPNTSLDPLLLRSRKTKVCIVVVKFEGIVPGVVHEAHSGMALHTC